MNYYKCTGFELTHILFFKDFIVNHSIRVIIVVLVESIFGYCFGDLIGDLAVSILGSILTYLSIFQTTKKDSRFLESP